MAPRTWLDAQIVPVVLAGGSGTRLWPLSRPDRPKQFLPLFGERSLFQNTALRLANRPEFAPPLVVCNAEHRFIAAEQLRAIGIEPRGFIVEPDGRNTAPAAALAALALASSDDAYMLLLPADHVIADAAAFCDAVGRGLGAARLGNLVTFGVLPDRPETGYGYVRGGGELDGLAGCFAVERFVEKPDRATAKGYLADGRYYWNSGIFLAGVRPFLDELARHRPDIAEGCAAALTQARRDGAFLWPAREPFSAIAGESIDYAVMERTRRAVVVPVDMGWSDVGSWSALAAALGDGGNATAGDVHALDVRNSYLRSESRLLAAVGVENVVVVETPDAVLVAAKDRVEDVKHLVASLKRQGRPEIEAHMLTERPWGWFRTLALRPGFQVKEIFVRPGAKLSLQRHRRRAEQWIVASGEALVTVGKREQRLAPRGYVDIPSGEIHRLANPGTEPLRVIEVQLGAYLGEDDIERLADDYGRADGAEAAAALGKRKAR
ncbi:MAG TPA: mannose-1-phosphate guanylyltransferase/mannose-6-phosphate isomerase [Alphaproteobacteria bacterium]